MISDGSITVYLGAVVAFAVLAGLIHLVTMARMEDALEALPEDEEGRRDRTEIRSIVLRARKDRNLRIIGAAVMVGLFTGLIDRQVFFLNMSSSVLLLAPALVLAIVYAIDRAVYRSLSLKWALWLFAEEFDPAWKVLCCWLLRVVVYVLGAAIFAGFLYGVSLVAPWLKKIDSLKRFRDWLGWWILLLPIAVPIAFLVFGTIIAKLRELFHGRR